VVPLPVHGAAGLRTRSDVRPSGRARRASRREAAMLPLHREARIGPAHAWSRLLVLVVVVFFFCGGMRGGDALLPPTGWTYTLQMTNDK